MLRFALYYAPQPETALAEAAAAWLGRDHANLNRARFTSAQLEPQRFSELTQGPYHYGFHGTLKPPFRLHDGTSEKMLCNELHRFCDRRKSFRIEAMEIAWLGKFLCLRPTKPSEEMNHLAQDAVQQLDRFRAQMSFTELEKRRKNGLTPEQDNLLLQWGYPYVLDEFCFHLTLSSTIDSSTDRELILEEAVRNFPPEILREIPVDGIALFTERDGTPMTQQEFFPFKG